MGGIFCGGNSTPLLTLGVSGSGGVEDIIVVGSKHWRRVSVEMGGLCPVLKNLEFLSGFQISIFYAPVPVTL